MYVDHWSRPYQSYFSPSFRLRQALIFGLFVGLFLWYFHPFQIDQMPQGIHFVSAGFGAVTFFGMLLTNVVVPGLFGAFFEAERWTVGKEIVWVSVTISTIGLFNFMFFCWFYPNAFTFTTLFWFQVNTLAIGVFPVSLFTLWNESRTRRKYSDSAAQLNQRRSPPVEASTDAAPASDPLIDIPSQNTNESLSLLLSDLLYIQVADNYLEVVHLQGGLLKKRLLRNTLKEVSEHLSAHPALLRCHKSFLVNMQQVYRVSGNAQGYRLHLHGTEESIPVSRQHNDTVRALFDGQP